MIASYYQQQIHDQHAVFDLFYRRNPFKGTYTVFAGLDRVLEFLENFRFTESQISYLRSILPHVQDEFFDWLSTLDTSQVNVYALDQGTFAFPSIPLLRVEGPLGICQLIETTLLNLINYPTLICTNARRFRQAAGREAKLSEFGLRRAQGPDGGMSASKYCYIGGFDSSSNVAAGYKYGIPITGTHAHAYVQSFKSLDDVKALEIKDGKGNFTNLKDLVISIRKTLPAAFQRTNDGELAAFIAYAQTFPRNGLFLVDTYDTLNSGVLNFITVSKALLQCSFQPLGIRLDSGDLATLSIAARKLIDGHLESDVASLVKIVASNDVSEAVLNDLKQRHHKVDIFGIGTMLVTCFAQAALGCVYKLTELENEPRIKLSETVEKTSLPGRKVCYRLFIASSPFACMDYLALEGEKEPVVGESLMVRHPFDIQKTMVVVPSKVVKLHKLVFSNGNVCGRQYDVKESKELVDTQVLLFDQKLLDCVDGSRTFNVGVSQQLYKMLHEMLEECVYAAVLE
ncbi:hypothetical protein P9112_010761 [Eukaryota sp. TZLM1-RC]